MRSNSNEKKGKSNNSLDLSEFNESYSSRWAYEMVEKQEKGKRVYHYTSLDAFYNILADVEEDFFTFRAGSVYTMNDVQEMKLGYEYLKEYLPKVEKRLGIKQEDKLFNMFKDVKKNENISEKFGEWLINDDLTNFVVSFSSSPNILPMWTLYGGNGAGVCLEFSPYIIKEYYNKNGIDENLLIKECVYNRDDIEELMMSELHIVYKLFLDENSDEQRLNPLTKAKYLATMCGITGAYVKHPCFEYEQEVRMTVFRPINDWNYGESRNGNRIVYVNVPIPLKALNNIVIGPAADMDKVRKALVMSLRTKGIHIDPTQSTMPYRNY